MVFTNADKIMVKVFRQDKGNSAKNWTSFLISNGRVQQWTDWCRRMTIRVQKSSKRILATAE